MPEKKKTRFERIYDKLSDEEKKYLAELPDRERAETLDFFTSLTKEERRILKKEIEHPLELTESEVAFVYEHPELVRKAHEISPVFNVIFN